MRSTLHSFTIIGISFSWVFFVTIFRVVRWGNSTRKHFALRVAGNVAGNIRENQWICLTSWVREVSRGRLFYILYRYYIINVPVPRVLTTHTFSQHTHSTVMPRKWLCKRADHRPPFPASMYSAHDTVVKTEIIEINWSPLFGDQTINVAFSQPLLRLPTLATPCHWRFVHQCPLRWSLCRSEPEGLPYVPYLRLYAYAVLLTLRLLSSSHNQNAIRTHSRCPRWAYLFLLLTI